MTDPLPLSLRSLADDPRVTPYALALGLTLGFGLGWLALELGPAAAVTLALLLAGGLWALRRRVDWVSERWPVAVELPPAPPQVDIAPSDPDLDPDSDSDPLIELVPLAGGRFWMGSGRFDWRAWGDERPRHRVTLSPFLMARTPVTRGLWRRVMASAQAPWHRDIPKAWRDGDDDLPATAVSWFDAVAFCNALSALSGHAPCYRETEAGWTCDWSADGYRLPTEAEWEFACRAGRQTPWNWGRWSLLAGRYAWYLSNSGGRLHPVGEKRPNRFGLHDMAGNCWEWCWDLYGAYSSDAVEAPHGPEDGRLRVLRGGSFDPLPRVLRSANRHRNEPEFRLQFIGFRCVRSGAPAS